MTTNDYQAGVARGSFPNPILLPHSDQVPFMRLPFPNPKRSQIMKRESPGTRVTATGTSPVYATPALNPKPSLCA